MYVCMYIYIYVYIHTHNAEPIKPWGSLDQYIVPRRRSGRPDLVDLVVVPRRSPMKTLRSSMPGAYGYGYPLVNIQR